MNIDVGAHLKAVRQMHGLSQRELAKRAGVTNGTISLIEQNRVSPSVSSLRKVLAGIPMSLGEFFTTDFSSAGKVFFQDDELTDLGTGDVQLKLVAAQRKERAMSVMHETYPPGADTGPDKDKISDKVHENVRKGLPGGPDGPSNEHSCDADFSCGDYDCVAPHDCSGVYNWK